jgi:hypothetical protein
LDLSDEDKRKVREMLEWSRKVRRVEAVFKESVLPLIVEVKNSSIEYDQYVRSYGSWLKQSSGPNRASAPPEPRKPRIIEEYPYWESTLIEAVNQVQRLQLTEPPEVTALKASDRFVAQAVTGSNNDRMHVVAQIMQWFLCVSTVADLQGQVGSIQEIKSEKAWDGELRRYRNSALFNKLNDREKEVRAQLEDVQKFVSLRSVLLSRVCNLKADESAFFKGKPSVQSYVDLYLKVMTPVLPEVPLGEEFGLLQEEVSAAMKALPPAP